MAEMLCKMEKRTGENQQDGFRPAGFHPRRDGDQRGNLGRTGSPPHSGGSRDRNRDRILESLNAACEADGLTRSEELSDSLRAELRSRLTTPPALEWTDKPSVIMMVGVNGSGKTTTIAKLGQRFQEEGKSLLFGAADTFRAAAVDQLQVWGDRLGVDVIAGAPESDPGAVAFNAVQAGVARGVDIILIDTAGRLHTAST
jgi:fused signal recognition particle receptor